MTAEEEAYERKVTVDTRLGILCGTGTPTAEQLRIARDEADTWIEGLEFQEWSKRQDERLAHIP